MTNRSRLITASVLTFAAGIILFFPARVAYQWFAPPDLSMSAITGSFWHGRAGEVFTNGVYLRDLQWQVRPLDFVTFKLGFAIETNLASGFIEGNIAFGVTGAIVARDISGSLPLNILQNVTEWPGLQGGLSIKFSELVFDAGLPVTANGVLEVSNLVVPLIDRNSIGGYKAEFFTQESGVIASVEDTDGVVEVAGNLSIFRDGSYEFFAQLSTKPGTPENLRQQMQFLGNELRFEGQL